MKEPTCNLLVKIEKLNVYEKNGQYALYGSTISNIQKINKKLILPTKIFCRSVKACFDCSYKTLYTSSYKSHQKHMHRNIHEDELYYCFQCSYFSNLKSSLKIHMFSHRKEKTLKCSHCSKLFKTQQSLYTHIKLIHKSLGIYCCDKCDFECKAKYYLKKHVERCHAPDSNRKEMFSCKLCPFQTNKKYVLQRHVKYKHTDNFKCTKCSFFTSFEESFKKHKCKLFECSHCDYKTSRSNHFKVHQTRHMDPEDLPLLKCPICPFTTKSPSSFSSHKNYDHKHKAVVKCPECQTTCLKKSLPLHIKIKHGKKKRETHFCSDCDYTTYHNGNLQRHIESNHTDKSQLETLKCQNCNYQTKSKGSFYQHQNQNYCNPVDMHICDQCSYTTYYKKSLVAHMKTHDANRKTVVCEICSKTFMSKHLLSSHIKRIHIRNDKYVCKSCPEGFQHVSNGIGNFRRHLLTHRSKTELDTFHCYHCPFKAKIKFELAKHIQKVHRSKTYNFCNVCCYKTKYKKNLKLHMKDNHQK